MRAHVEAGVEAGPAETVAHADLLEGASDIFGQPRALEKVGAPDDVGGYLPVAEFLNQVETGADRGITAGIFPALQDQVRLPVIVGVVAQFGSDAGGEDGGITPAQFGSEEQTYA